jgi:glutamate-1-semialdehyde 2,1-aminomutase
VRELRGLSFFPIRQCVNTPSMTKNTRSQAIFSKAKTFFPGGVNSPVRAFKSVGCDPFIVESGQGPYLIDVDGNRYVDYINSWGPLVLGHAYPAVVEAIAHQAARGTSYGACHDLEWRLAELVQGLFPSMEMMRFVNSGTEAGMAVIRLARGYTKRQKLVKFEGCYHGHADVLLAKAGSGVLTLGLPDCAGVPAAVVGDTLVADYNNLESVERLFAACGSEIAAVIVEPVVGNCGLLVPQPGFLAGLRAITERHGALLILDEVMTGFRVALKGAQGLYGVTPDLTMLGKVIGGGLPVGAFGGRREIMEMLAPLGPVYQAGTLSGNPLAMVAGMTTLTEWSKPGVFDATAAATQRLVHGLREAAAARGIAIQAESVGTMFGFFFSPEPVLSYRDTQRADKEAFNRFFKAMLEEGVYFAPSAFEAGFVSHAHIGEAIDHTLLALPHGFAAVG